MNNLDTRLSRITDPKAWKPKKLTQSRKHNKKVVIFIFYYDYSTLLLLPSVPLAYFTVYMFKIEYNSQCTCFYECCLICLI